MFRYNIIAYSFIIYVMVSKGIMKRVTQLDTYASHGVQSLFYHMVEQCGRWIVLSYVCLSSGFSKETNY